jgi:cbb3-type cytochrome oxidase maturation protein
VVAIIGASAALAAFLWALRTRQFSLKHLNEGAMVIFDNAEAVGEPTDQIFKKPDPRTDEPSAR